MAIALYCDEKIKAHPDNMVALVPMGPLQGSSYARPTRDLDEILFTLKGTKPHNGHKEESKTTPLRTRLLLVGRRSSRARQAKTYILIGIYFTHLVASSAEGNMSSKIVRTSLTRNTPSPFRSQIHLSLEAERVTEPET
nr:hypothetical protein [Tanacetum cinerariifolium]